MTTNETAITLTPCYAGFMARSSQGRSNEKDLIVAAQAGTPGAMDELLVRHRGALYRAARRFTTSHEDAEDLVQDAMLRAFVNIGKFRKESRFGTWLIAIVNNSALSMKRKAKGLYWMSIDNSKDEFGRASGWDLPDSRFDPEREIIREELLRLLHSVILRQSKAHQIILKTCIFDDRPIREAAPALGLTTGSAKSCLYRARRRLSDSFAKRGIVKRRFRSPKAVL